jgi:hypothetical protein
MSKNKEILNMLNNDNLEKIKKYIENSYFIIDKNSNAKHYINNYNKLIKILDILKILNKEKLENILEYLKKYRNDRIYNIKASENIFKKNSPPNSKTVYNIIKSATLYIEKCNKLISYIEKQLDTESNCINNLKKKLNQIKILIKKINNKKN